MSLTYNIVSHTHWDREWYQTQEQFRIRLVHLVDNLLDILEDEPRFRFHLDAQTIVLEDYLDIRPEKESVLKGHIRNGRIFVGPWYVQNDFSLTSGESTVRNLQLGMHIAGRFGGCSMTGYVPDQFGLCGQLPQIFSRFGIGSCIFGRGVVLKDGDCSEFRWRSADGSEVFCVFLPFWYNNAQRFSASIEKSLKHLEHIKGNSLKFASTGQLLLMNGVDHLEAQEDLFTIMDELRDHLDVGEELRQVSLQEYLDGLELELTASGKMQGMRTYSGEMRQGPEASILSGTLSSRADLKRRNSRSQTLLERRLEPLACIAAALEAQDYPQGHLDFLWKLLLQNHPHDSICGCHLDEITRHMIDRSERLDESGRMLLDQTMKAVMAQVDRSGFTSTDTLIGVFNTEPYTRSGWLDLCLDIPEEDDLGSLRINDESGSEIRFDILERVERAIGVMSPVNLPGVLTVVSYRIRLFVESVKPMGYMILAARVIQEAAMKPACSQVTDRVLENEACRILVNDDGTLEYTEFRSGKTYSGLLRIEDREDIGDSYIYGQDPRLEPILGACGKAEISLKKLETGTGADLSYFLRVPQSYDMSNGRRSEETVDLPVRIRLFLPIKGSGLEIAVQVENNACDHRVRFLFPVSPAGDSSFAAAPFELIKRYPAEDKAGDSVIYHPNAGLVASSDGSDGLAILNEGLYEYEHSLEESTLALTFFRGNSFIARNGAMPVAHDWIIPGNQCLGPHECRLAILPYSEQSGSATLIADRDAFLNPLFACVQAKDVRKFAGGRPFVQDSSVGDIFFRPNKHPDLLRGREYSFFKLEGEGIVLSSVRKCANGKAWIVRMFNTLDTPSLGTLRFADVPGGGSTEAWEVSLLDERIEKLGVLADGIHCFDFHPKQIRTVEVAFEGL